ncbi:MAG: hypothetical protein IPH83_04250 [Gammaproteobacteria bacterium]|nr:hypothetical protein [Gammaproteobacteria bacterium]
MSGGLSMSIRRCGLGFGQRGKAVSEFIGGEVVGAAINVPGDTAHEKA